MTEERSGRAVPDTVPGQRAARLGKSLSGVAAIIAANLFGWLMWSLFSSPGRFGADPTPGYLWCACFAVLATASSVIAAIAHGRAMPGVSVVATLAMWGLLPITVFFCRLAYTALSGIRGAGIYLPDGAALAGIRRAACHPPRADGTRHGIAAGWTALHSRCYSPVRSGAAAGHVAAGNALAPIARRGGDSGAWLGYPP